MIPRCLYGEQAGGGSTSSRASSGCSWTSTSSSGIIGPPSTAQPSFSNSRLSSRDPRLPIIQAARDDTPAPPPTLEDINRLAELYAPDLELLSRLSGLDVSAWPTRQVVEGRLTAADFADRLARKAGLVS
jgi:hypothetical protein